MNPFLSVLHAHCLCRLLYALYSLQCRHTQKDDVSANQHRNWRKVNSFNMHWDFKIGIIQRTGHISSNIWPWRTDVLLRRQKEHVRTQGTVSKQHWGEIRSASWNVRNLTSDTADRKIQESIKTGGKKASKTTLKGIEDNLNVVDKDPLPHRTLSQLNSFLVSSMLLVTHETFCLINP
jgi:hypothetical protein